MDVNLARKQLTMMQELHNIDDIYTFYYDETNNVRRLYLTENGLNAEAKNFVLGGIVYKGYEKSLDYIKLVDSLQLQKNITEVKLKHIAKGNVLELLNTSKLSNILQWLLNNDVSIHYHNLDILYWSTLDIIESIMAEMSNSSYYPYHRYLKNCLYKIIRLETDNFMGILYGYDYPNLNQDRISGFITHLFDLTGKYRNILNRYEAELLISFINDAKPLLDLPFIRGEQTHTLIDHFYIFYTNRFCLFKNSFHILDNEEKIKSRLAQEPITESGNLFCNYKFVDSKANVAIQISDIIAGFLGKYFSYVSKTEMEQLIMSRSNLSTTQDINLCLFRDLINHSDNVSNAFLHSISCDDDQMKSNYFLFEQPF